MDENLQTAIGLLETEAKGSENPAAMVVLPPDMGDSILGNRGGFVLLAIAALKAAQGQDQKFAKEPWVCHEDVDWEIDGLKFDALAHMHLPEKPPKWRVWRSNMIEIAVMALLVGCFVVGLGTLVSWISPLLHRL
jgi:hypothetical protein